MRRCFSRKRARAERSYYVLTVVIAEAAERPAERPQDWEIARKIWFDRADLSIARIETYDPGGKLASDVRYSNWDTFGDGAISAPDFSGAAGQRL